MIVAESPLTPALMNCHLSKRQVLNFLSAKKVWLALAAAIAHTPQLPSDAAVGEAPRVSSTQPLDAKMRTAIGSMVPGARKYGNLGEDKKTGFLTSSDGGANALALADDSA